MGRMESLVPLLAALVTVKVLASVELVAISGRQKGRE
jgi:hypothetical protein